MDVENPCKDAPVMMKKCLRVEKSCNACGTTMMLTMYGPINGLRECQRDGY
jgi:hypothetical protein